MTHGSMTSVQIIRRPGQKGSTWRLFLGFGRIAGWSDGTASGVQATELPILALVLISGLEDLEGAHEGLVHTHHGTSIVKLATVVGGREECHQLPFGKELVAIFYNLVKDRNGLAWKLSSRPPQPAPEH